MDTPTNYDDDMFFDLEDEDVVVPTPLRSLVPAEDPPEAGPAASDPDKPAEAAGGGLLPDDIEAEYILTVFLKAYGAAFGEDGEGMMKSEIARLYQLMDAVQQSHQDDPDLWKSLEGGEKNREFLLSLTADDVASVTGDNADELRAEFEKASDDERYDLLMRHLSIDEFHQLWTMRDEKTASIIVEVEKGRQTSLALPTGPDKEDMKILWPLWTNSKGKRAGIGIWTSKKDESGQESSCYIPVGSNSCIPAVLTVYLTYADNKRRRDGNSEFLKWDGKVPIKMTVLENALGFDMREHSGAKKSRRQAREDLAFAIIQQFRDAYGLLYNDTTRRPCGVFEYDEDRQILQMYSPHVLAYLRKGCSAYVIQEQRYRKKIEEQKAKGKTDSQALASARSLIPKEIMTRLIKDEFYKEKDTVAKQIVHYIVGTVQRHGSTPEYKRNRKKNYREYENWQTIVICSFKITDIIRECSALSESMNRQSNNSRRGQQLRRHLNNAERILKEDTRMSEFYKDFSCSFPTATPWKDRNDDIILITHHGEDPNFKLPQSPEVVDVEAAFKPEQ